MVVRPLNDLDQQRTVQEKVSTLAVSELRHAAAQVDWAKTDQDSAALSDLFQAVTVRIVDKYAAVAATVAADFYDACRASAGVRVPFRAQAQPAPPETGIEAQVRFAARWLFGADPQPEPMLDFLAGEIDKKVKQAFRDTMAVSARLDPARPKIRRTTAGTCEFCENLADRDFDMAKRGADRSEVNDYHPGCLCVPVAVWAGDTGVLTGRFGSVVEGMLEAAVEKATTIVDGRLRQILPRAAPPGYAHLAKFIAPPDNPWMHFKPSERAHAAKIRHAFGIELQSIDNVAVQKAAQAAKKRGVVLPMKAPDGLLSGTESTLEMKRLINASGSPDTAILNALRDARRQSRNVTVDGSGFGVTASDATAGIRRALGSAGDDFDFIMVLLDRSRLAWKRE